MKNTGVSGWWMGIAALIIASTGVALVRTASEPALDAEISRLVADVLADMRQELPGTVKFIFQPAEEAPSDYVYAGDRAFGAKKMVTEGVLRNPDVDVVQ